MTKSSWILLVLAAVLIFLIFIAPQLAWQARLAIFGRNAESDAAPSDVLALKSELAKLENIKSQLPEKPWNYIRAIVLSRYPMNFKNEFLIDAGSADGVAEKKAVIFGGALIGRVKKVFQNTAIVETVFSPGFEVAVRIGPDATDALFRGGLAPKLTLIPLKAVVRQGDAAYAASPDFPYGLPLGSVRDVRISADKLFQEAALEFPYDINSVKSVLVAK